MTLSTSSVRATETTCQSSYPRKSENARPFGTRKLYLSCCAAMATPTTSASTDTAAETAHTVRESDWVSSSTAILQMNRWRIFEAPVGRADGGRRVGGLAPSSGPASGGT